MRIGSEPRVQHQLRLGDRVYQRVNAWHTGTVTKLDGYGFTVTYDGHGRKPRQPRSRVSYPASMQADFLVGTPHPDLLIWEREIEADNEADNR